MAAAANKTYVDLDEVDVSDLDFEEYIAEHGGSASYLSRPVAGQVRKDKEYDDTIPGRKYWKKLFRDGDIPDYEEMLESGYEELSDSEYDVDVEDLELDHLDAEGYEEDALEDYREAIERVLEE